MKFIIRVDPCWSSLLQTSFFLSMPGSREDFLRNNAFSLHVLYGHALAQETLAPRVMNVTILVDV